MFFPDANLCDPPRTMLCPTCQANIEGAPKFCPRCGSKVEPAPMSATQAQPATEVQRDPFLGQTIGGRYRVIKLLGEGGMGAVYLGEQMIAGTAKKFAIKTLHTHLSHDPKILARFERECGTVAGLSHPNIIQLVDFGKTEDGTLYMVMEFVEGRSLATLLEEKRSLEPKRASHILQQICDALAEAHGHGIVHRDLKPDNIVLTERAKDFVKVLDFGIAKRGDDALAKEEQKLTQQGTVLGTPPYMSPEQFTGKPIDLRSDLYSIGVIAYEMLAGHLPFNANTPWEWATQHMTVPPVALATAPSGEPIPASMRAAVMKALEKDPLKRFASATEFFDAFESDPVQATSAPAPVAPSGQKGRTEIGTPLDLPAMGGAPPASPYGPPPTPAQGAPSNPAYPPYGAPPSPMQAPYTPIGGNVAFPTPAATPQAPARTGGSKTGLVVGLVGLLLVSSVALVFGLKKGGLLGGGGGSNRPPPPPADTTEPAAPVVIETATPVSPDADAPTPDTTIAPLTLPPGHKPPALAHHDAGAPPPPGGYDPCVAAKNFMRVHWDRDAAHKDMFAGFKAKCLAQGGKL
jgi:serine/threonine-protein kinase